MKRKSRASCSSESNEKIGKGRWSKKIIEVKREIINENIQDRRITSALKSSCIYVPGPRGVAWSGFDGELLPERANDPRVDVVVRSPHALRHRVARLRRAPHFPHDAIPAVRASHRLARRRIWYGQIRNTRICSYMSYCNMPISSRSLFFFLIFAFFELNE